MLCNATVKLDDINIGQQIEIRFGTEDVIAWVRGRFNGVFRCRETKQWRIAVSREVGPEVDHEHFVRTDEITELRLV